MRDYLGIAGQSWELPAAMRRQLPKEPRTAVLVMEVAQDGPAWRASLRPRDLIVQIGDQSISTVDDLHRFLDEQPVGSQY